MTPYSDDLSARQAAAQKRLSRDWLVTAAMALVALLAMAQLLLAQWVQATVGRWAIIAGLAIFYELRIFKQMLPLMHRPGEKTLQMGIGLTTKLTLLSGLGYALLAGFLLVTQPEGLLGWLPPALALAALLADALGGTLARKRRNETIGGQHLAQEFRALGSLVLTVMAIHYGRLDSWFLLIGVMNYLHLFTISWLGRKKKPIGRPPERLRYFLRSLYLAALAIILLPPVSSEFAVLLGVLFGVPYFLLALRDWFILTGLLDPKQSQYQQIADAVTQALTGWLALTIRLLAAMAATTVAADMIFHFDLYTKAFGETLIPGAVTLALLVALPFLFLGIKARLAALAGFIALSAIILVVGWNPVIFVGLILLGLTIILGQGKMAVEKEAVTEKRRQSP